MSLLSQLESLLFVASKALSVKELASLTQVPEEEVKKTLEELAAYYQDQGRGVILIKHNLQYQLTSSPDNSELVGRFLKDESSGELSQASLEALTIIAYRGPISKLELERIRGVNCSMIIRNLLLRGLIEEKMDKHKNESFYLVTLDFIKFLGITEITELPDYEKLHKHESIEQVLEQSLVMPL